MWVDSLLFKILFSLKTLFLLLKYTMLFKKAVFPLVRDFQREEPLVNEFSCMCSAEIIDTKNTLAQALALSVREVKACAGALRETTDGTEVQLVL